jgi:hypothetical protein
MFNAELLSKKFKDGLTYAAYVTSGKPEHQQRWQQFYERVRLTSDQLALVRSFTRQMNVLVVSGTWCGDCIQQVPFIQHIGETNPRRIEARFLDRDLHKDLSSQLRINAGDRVPVVLFLAEDFELCALAGDRTLSRYRAIVQRQLGAACSTGIVPPDQDEVSLTLSDWVNEFERVQLMLRLSPRLRQKHGD